jgi:hypothetical protein
MRLSVESTAATIFLIAAMALAQDKALGPDFKKEAWKALDAIERIDFTLSEESRDKNKTLISDAEKAVAEAKYVATTTSDKQMLMTLEIALQSFELQGTYSIRDPKAEPYFDRHVQCIAGTILFRTREDGRERN